MTKYKLDDLLKATPTPELDPKTLNNMIENALAQPQVKPLPRAAQIIPFPRSMVAGGAATGLVAALLLVALNLPVNQQTMVQYTQLKSTQQLAAANTTETFDDMDIDTADFLMLEMLEI